MGSFHCIPSSCVEVRYQTYLPSSVEYRYPSDQKWTVIHGADDYEINQNLGQCDTKYLVEGRSATNGLSYCGADWQRSTELVNHWALETEGKIKGIATQVEGFDRPRFATKSNGLCDARSRVGTTRNHLGYLDWEGLSDPQLGSIIYFDQSFLGQVNNIIVIDSITRLDGEPDDCGTCDFTVKRGETVVHFESRSDCPEVRLNSCRLDDQVKVIEIEKVEHLEGIEVADFARDLYLKTEIPQHCLNVHAIWLQPSIIPIPGIYDSRTVDQICSSPNCPPPKYEVICDCDKEKCPDGTCPCLCGDHVCCHDTTTGKAVEQIPLENYDNSGGI